MLDTILQAQAQAFSANVEPVSNIRRFVIREAFMTNRGPHNLLSVNDVNVAGGSMEYLKQILKDRG
jgi:hypothetical protein